MPENDRGVVLHIPGVECCANFIQWRPLPLEINIRCVVLLADSGDAEKLPASHRNTEILPAGGIAGDQVAEGVDAKRSESDVPAWRRNEIGGAGDIGAGDPTVALEHEVVGGKVVLVGNDSSSQPELLWGLECLRAGDEVDGQTAGEEVARRTSGQTEQQRKRSQGFA